MAENMARKELTPMEEARGFHSLVERGIGTAMIAERIGVTQRFVQQRLALVEKAAVEVQKALEEGKITVTHARTLMLAKPTEQKKLVKRMTAPADEDDSDDYDNEWLRDERNLRNEVLGNVPETAWALFDRKLYKGEIIEDGGGKSYFADRKQFEKLQKAAVDAKAEELRKTFTFVDVTDDFRDWEWEVDAKSKDAAIIETHHGGRVSIHTGLVAREQPSYSRGGGSDAAFLNKSTKKAAPEDAFTHGHRVHAHVRKTFALQRTIAADSPTAMRMLCHALLLSVRAPALNIGRKDSRYDCGSFKDYDGPTTAPEVNEILAELIDGCPGVKMSAKSGLGTAAATHALAIWTWLTKQSVEKVVRLLAALTADCAGTWCDGYNMPIDDDEVAVAIAQQVNLAGNEHKCGLTLQPADLDGLRKPALAGIARDLKIDLKVGVHALTKMTGKAVTAEICSAIDAGDAKTYVLPTLRFTADSAAEIKALTKDPAAKAAAKPATKAKANKKAKR
jgi:ParB-like chromosome segregation protein Spo0J